LTNLTQKFKRINIFDEEEEEEASKLKPFEPTKTTKKRDLKYLDAHDQNRQKVHDVGVNLGKLHFENIFAQK
jgi:hypothetical protein